MSDAAAGTPKSKLFLVAGVAAGVLSVILLSLPAKWAVSGIVGLILAAVALLVSDLRRYVQTLLVLTIPFATLAVTLFARRTYFGIPGIRFGIVEVLLIALYAEWLIRGVSRQRFLGVMRSPVNVAAMVLGVVTAVSVAVAGDRVLAGFGVVALVEAYLVFLYVANVVTASDDVWWVTDGLAGALLVQECFALAQYVTRSSLGLATLGESSQLMQQTFGSVTYVRVAGTLIHPNHFANFLGLALPLVLAAVVTGAAKGWRRHAYSVVFMFGAVIFLLTYSRTGWFHIAASTLVVLALGLRGRRLSREITNLAIVGALLVAILLVAFSGSIADRLLRSNPVWVTDRIDMGRIAWRIVADHPVLGVGVNNYVDVLPRYNFLHVMEAPVHNLYLLLFAEMGVLGIAAFLALVVAIILTAWRARRSSVPAAAAAGLGILGALVGFLVDGIADFSYILPSTFLLFWMLAGLAASLRWAGAVEEGSGETADRLPLRDR